MSASDLASVAPGVDSRPKRLVALLGLAALTGYLYAADPSSDGVYPLCPSRALLGIDCPGCGGLRGTHDLLHGRIGEALDHNLLLPGLLGAATVALTLWMLPLVGRSAPPVRLPRWAGAGLAVVLAAFTVARNLPFDAFTYLASDA